MKLISAVLVALVLLFSVCSYSITCSQAVKPSMQTVSPTWTLPQIPLPPFEYPPPYSYDGERFVQIGTPLKKQLQQGQELSFLVWNIEKLGSKKTYDYLAGFHKNVDFMMLQEARIGAEYTVFLESLKPMLWDFAVGFYYQDKTGAGVTTGGKYLVEESSYVESIPREPIANTPKMAVVNKYPIKNSKESLMLINIHGINFVGLQSFKTHMKQFETYLSSHKGPIIFAGDFNTWNSGKFKFLQELNEKYGLELTPLDTDTRRLKLDHVFVRGLTVVEAAVLNKINSSDHFPIHFSAILD